MSNRRALWRVEVLRHRAPGMNGEVRALLLELIEHMDHRGYVSVPRRELAAAFDVPERRITERLQRARELGLLDTVRHGRPGVTAVYQALLPGSHGASPRTMRGPLGENQDGASPRTMSDDDHAQTPESTHKLARGISRRNPENLDPAHGAAARTIKTPLHGASPRPATGSTELLSPDSEPAAAQAALALGSENLTRPPGVLGLEKSSSSNPNSGPRSISRPRGRLGPRPAPSTATTDHAEAI